MRDDVMMAEILDEGAARQAPGYAVFPASQQAGCPQPGWDRTWGLPLLSPAVGAGFSMYLVVMDPSGSAGPARPWSERLLYVLEGEMRVEAGELKARLRPGDYAHLPPETPAKVLAASTCRSLVIDHNYHPLPQVDPPRPAAGRTSEAQPKPAFAGDTGIVRQLLLPPSPAYDLSVNVHTFAPGAATPAMAATPTQRACYVLEGSAVLRVGDAWMRLAAGDAFFLRTHTPFWMACVGAAGLRVLDVQPVNRDFGAA